eukprot:TRINITY_DN9272_c1_g1_i1.p1 TRINITY_DN9272_c1_g1~~TRINITY_DN9272_c1_g1_i1.p1  ORF type:complete len:103 (-),score=15.37 TRINITY_DN9272_c1_g1_i1:19-327(-)
MCGKSRKDEIKNECFQKNLGVASLGDKIRETCLRWFGHVQDRLAMVPVTKVFSKHVDGPTRGMGRPKKMWMEVATIGRMFSYEWTGYAVQLYGAHLDPPIVT